MSNEEELTLVNIFCTQKHITVQAWTCIKLLDP